MIFRWYKFVEWVESCDNRAEQKSKSKKERLKRWHFHFALMPRLIFLPVESRLLLHVAWLTTIARRATYSNSHNPNKKLYEYGPITNVVTQKGFRS